MTYHIALAHHRERHFDVTKFAMCNTNNVMCPVAKSFLGEFVHLHPTISAWRERKVLVTSLAKRVMTSVHHRPITREADAKAIVEATNQLELSTVLFQTRGHGKDAN